MKRNILLLAAMLLGGWLFAQAPQGIPHQAVIRNASNELVRNQYVGVRTTILQGAIDGTEVYQEIFNPNPQTNANGLVTFIVGSGG